MLEEFSVRQLSYIYRWLMTPFPAET